MSTKTKYILMGMVLVIAVCLMTPLIISIRNRSPVTVAMNNQTGVDITAVKISQKTESPASAPNLISQPVSTGNILQVSHLGHGCTRNMEVDYSDGTNQSFANLNACSGTTLMLTKNGPETENEKGNPSFNLVNTGTVAAKEVNVTPSSKDEWGINRLVGDKSLAQGETIPIYLPSGECMYDVRVIFADASRSVQRKVNACRVSAVSVP